MAGTWYGKNQKPFPEEEPDFYSSHQKSAWRKGFAAFVYYHRQDILTEASPPRMMRLLYTRRHMQQAFLAGWDAAAKIDRETPDPPKVPEAE